MTLLDHSLLSDVLARAERGERLSAADAEALLGADDAAFERVLAAASRARDDGLRLAGRPGIITYSRKVFVPLTTLCRDRCHYCVFVDTPGQLLKKRKPPFMSPAQVLAVVKQGQALGCKEALLTLGDRPEDRWPEAREWLDANGYASTLEYVAAMARLIREETGLLPHLNPGVMRPDELVMLRKMAPSIGVMLETTSRRLFEEQGQVHYGSPDKDPAVRLQLLEDAGAARIPFTTGILVGIGESLRDRAESMIALRDSHDRHGHIQEVIVQNFRAKPRTAMQNVPDAALREYVAAVAVMRLVFGPRMRIQVPPNLQDPVELELLVRAGADDWGGVSPLTADHVNPERPWPHLDDLAARTRELGFVLSERLTAHPEFLGPEWVDEGLRDAVDALADPETGLGRASTIPRGVARSDVPEERAEDHTPTLNAPGGLIAAIIERAAQDPASLDDSEWERLLTATGDELEAVVRTADDVRRYTVGEAVSIVGNRNIASTHVRLRRDEPGTFILADAEDMARDAWQLGLTEVCVQGMIPAHMPAETYLDIARSVRRGAPDIHLHAFRPQDIRDLADRTGLGTTAALSAMRDAGVDTVPGTGVKVLSERVRRELMPSDLEIDAWTETIIAAHGAGFTSTSVLFYGHIETAAERIAHLRELMRIHNLTGGFTEFVPIPLPGAGTPLVGGRQPIDEHRAMAAVSRLMLTGTIPHIQIPWTRHGRAVTAELLCAGGDDLGGTLLDGRVSPLSGVEHGQELPLDAAGALVRPLMRPLRLRTTTYGEISAERRAAAARGAAGSEATR
ncbi:7,8-didemethyl-8-hydroxy-5-deazariboflavin synthase CofG [Microbacterium amylolyticum]|uniref:7,8-didemethyl-8-hydroxy-5-deazariboflavin synthase n=1 Tax=Microbacterium amylolyticum TaxID=936337 RepID=A0ABS4ZHC5_9MICO|nr:7,8-didemethyl-8-hydroxy-5-deazariboflavin synthase CofG [Microbacterium amylolyticum]MBP2436678.1 FO synthase [Microbacterium amylolyticum]